MYLRPCHGEFFQALLVFLALLLPFSCHGSTAAASTPSASSNQERLERLGLQGVRPDPFVAASPLIVAAVCSDGIAMVAAHTVSKKEKLLRNFDPEKEAKTKNENKDDESDDKHDKRSSFAKIWKDLPNDHGGPYRINQIDRSGTHLLSAGWRADCDLLVEKIRSLASQELALFGSPQWGIPYGRMLAQKSSFWMAQLAASEHVSVCAVLC